MTSGAHTEVSIDDQDQGKGVASWRYINTNMTYIDETADSNKFTKIFEISHLGAMYLVKPNIQLHAIVNLPNSNAVALILHVSLIQQSLSLNLSLLFEHLPRLDHRV